MGSVYAIRFSFISSLITRWNDPLLCVEYPTWVANFCEYNGEEASASITVAFTSAFFLRLMVFWTSAEATNDL
jgi:hypothetical protein